MKWLRLKIYKKFYPIGIGAFLELRYPSKTLDLKQAYVFIFSY
jgi:hypothetical protein